MVSSPSQIEIQRSESYARWFSSLRDQRAIGRILARIRRLSVGNFGDSKALGGGVSELRIDYGPGYRVYYSRRGSKVVLLLTGGDKSRQRADIAKARQIAAQWESD